MTKWRRVRDILGGLLTIALTPLLLVDAEVGCILIILLLGCSAAVGGAGMLLYYLSMARHMVGGGAMLYRGIILLDLGLFTIGFADIHSQYIMIYLLIGYLFYGLVGILRAMEIRRFAVGSWRFRLMVGIGNIALGLTCLIRFNSMRVTVAVYCLGLLWSAVGRIVTALRATAVVYVGQP